MEIYKLENDITVFCITAKSFPDGIMESYNKLHSLVPESSERRYFGLSQPNEDGEIIYKAAAEELVSGESEKLGCDPFIIKRGEYISITIQDYMKNVHEIGTVFQKMITTPNIDPEGCCVEWYLEGNKDVRCMIRLISDNI